MSKIAASPHGAAHGSSPVADRLAQTSQHCVLMVPGGTGAIEIIYVTHQTDGKVDGVSIRKRKTKETEQHSNLNITKSRRKVGQS